MDRDMRATAISVSVRYSKPLADDSHKTVELGCEATLNNSEETWQEAQTALYKQLGEQMRYVWSGISHCKANTQEQHSNGSDGPAAPRQHFCVQPNQDYKQRNRQYGEFWSHQIRGTKEWCNEKATK